MDSHLRELCERLAGAAGPDRELDCLLHVALFGWKLTQIGPDYDGGNVCEVYTPDGKPIQGLAYPPRGKIGQFYHVPDVRYTASLDASLALVERLLPRRSAVILQRALQDHALWTRAELENIPFPQWLPLALLSALITSLSQRENT